MLVAVGDHGSAAVPSTVSDDVNFGGEKRVSCSNDRADVEVVLPVFDGNVEFVAAAV